jgi:hypothetical protein
MPKSTVVEILQEEQAQMLAALRRARYGYVLALHIVLWCAAGRNPTDIAAVLFCSRSSVYRTVRAYRAGTLGLVPDDDCRLSPPVRHDRAGPDAAPVAASPAQGTSPGLWRVPHPLELCYLGCHLQGQTRPHSVGGDHAALGPRGRLGVEAGQTGRQRRRPAPRGAPGPHPLGLGALAAVGSAGGCGRTGYPSAA